MEQEDTNEDSEALVFNSVWLEFQSLALQQAFGFACAIA
jgi:hypothetical protein